MKLKRHLPRILATTGLIMVLLSATVLASPTLKQGSHGHDVLLLQQRLTKVGYPLKSLDGIFGAETERAVTDFQRDQKLKITGVVNNATWRALKEAKEKPLPAGWSATVPSPAQDPDIKPIGKAAPSGKTLITATEAQALLKTAKSYMGTPYTFGGTTPKAFDCSGYVQYVFAKQGLQIPRTADIQYEKVGVNTKSSKELVPGDLVFFETYEPGASHVGIYLGKGDFIHASSQKGVTVSNLSEDYWTTHYYGGKHIVK